MTLHLTGPASRFFETSRSLQPARQVNAIVMRRSLINLAAAMSLLLCVAACVLWVRSHGLTDQLVWRRADGQRSIASYRGRVVLSLWMTTTRAVFSPPDGYELHHSREKSSPANFSAVHVSVDRGSTYCDWKGGGLEWYLYRPLANNYLIVRAVAPHWFLATTTAILPLVCSGRKVRAHVRDGRRERLGLCRTCGYDLRVTPKDGRCPECGWFRTNHPSRRGQNQGDAVQIG
jgi:hypothetical protein